MPIVDEVLPAATALAGPGGAAVLAPVVEAAGGVLRSGRCTQLHYRPGRELVARFDCDVEWDGQTRPETLLAATTAAGSFAGAVPVTAEAEGQPLEVGVWRWPFDPVLRGLADAAEHTRVSALLDAPDRLTAEVVAYRPTERAVLRLTVAAGTVGYLKVVPPPLAADIAQRHHRLLAAGVPVPAVLHVDETRGWVMLAAIEGPTLRDHVRSPGPSGAPSSPLRPGALAAAVAALWDIHPWPDLAPRSTRARDSLAHLGLLRRIVPSERGRLDQLDAVLRPLAERSDARRRWVVHGDLHEAQLVVSDHGDVAGVLDLDDVGLGDPVDDLAVLLAHLEYRSIVGGAAAAAIGHQAQQLRRAVFDRLVERVDVDADELDATIAAVLVGLASGPFRVQAEGWRGTTRRILDAAVART